MNRDRTVNRLARRISRGMRAAYDEEEEEVLDGVGYGLESVRDERYSTGGRRVKADPYTELRAIAWNLAEAKRGVSRLWREDLSPGSRRGIGEVQKALSKAIAVLRLVKLD